jgi:membrane protease YdiL (CAAX protease family)
MLLFFVLACAFGWVFYLLHAVGVDPTEPSNLPLGPLLAAAVTAAVVGRTELRKWWRQLLTLRARTGWYVLAFVAPVVIIVLAVLANYALGAPLPTSSQLATWPELPISFLFILIFIGIGEEAGWMAFAAPRLLDRYSLMTAWVILTTGRFVWHLPLVFSGELSWTLVIIGQSAFQFLVLWLFYRTDVWLLAAIWHTVLNTVGGGYFFQMVDGANQARLGVLMSLGYALAAGAVYLALRRRTKSSVGPEERYTT